MDGYQIDTSSRCTSFSPLQESACPPLLFFLLPVHVQGLNVLPLPLRKCVSELLRSFQGTALSGPVITYTAIDAVPHLVRGGIEGTVCFFAEYCQFFETAQNSN